MIYDAEHFFDGWKLNPEYALKTVRAAAEAGAKIIVLCDTNGGTHARGGRRADQGGHRRPAACRWAFTATTTATWRSPIRWRRSMPAPCRCRARSTASANAAATPT